MNNVLGLYKALVFVALVTSNAVSLAQDLSFPHQVPEAINNIDNNTAAICGFPEDITEVGNWTRVGGGSMASCGLDREDVTAEVDLAVLGGLGVNDNPIKLVTTGGIAWGVLSENITIGGAAFNNSTEASGRIIIKLRGTGAYVNGTIVEGGIYASVSGASNNTKEAYFGSQIIDGGLSCGGFGDCKVFAGPIFTSSSTSRDANDILVSEDGDIFGEFSVPWHVTQEQPSFNLVVSLFAVQFGTEISLFGGIQTASSDHLSLRASIIFDNELPPLDHPRKLIEGGRPDGEPLQKSYASLSDPVCTSYTSKNGGLEGCYNEPPPGC